MVFSHIQISLSMTVDAFTEYSACTLKLTLLLLLPYIIFLFHISVVWFY